MSIIVIPRGTGRSREILYYASSNVDEPEFRSRIAACDITAGQTHIVGSDPAVSKYRALSSAYVSIPKTPVPRGGIICGCVVEFYCKRHVSTGPVHGEISDRNWRSDVDIEGLN